MIENLARIPIVEESQTQAHAKLAIATFGGPGSGKTRFCLTAPAGKRPKGGIGIIPLERKTKPTFQEENKKFQKRLYWPGAETVRHDNPMKIVSMKGNCKNEVTITNTPQAPACCEIHYYKWHRMRILASYYSMAENPDIETIVIDSGSQLKEDLLMAHYGRTQKIMARERGEFNQDWKDILNSCQHKHLIITHHPSEVWRNDKPTGKFTWDGYNKIGHQTNLIIEQRYDPSSKVWSMECVMCQHRPDLIGSPLPDPELFSDQDNDSLTFQNVALSVYPDADPEDYE